MVQQSLTDSVGCDIPGEVPWLASAKHYVVCGHFLKFVKAKLSSLFFHLKCMQNSITHKILQNERQEGYHNGNIKA